MIEFPTVKTASLAAMLLLHAGEPLRRERLIAEFWPEREKRRAQMSLRTALAAIRKRLGPDVLVSARDSIGICRERFELQPLSDVANFAPEFTEDWAEAVRGRRGLSGAAAGPTVSPPIVGLMPALDYLLEVDPEQAVAFACASRVLLVHVPIGEVMPRLERLRRSTRFETKETLELRVFLATRYLARAQFEPAIEVLKGVVPEAERLALSAIAEAAAYHLFAGWVLLDRPDRARNFLKWLSANGSPATARMAEGMWSFQYELDESTAHRLRLAAEAARDSDRAYFEQTALACLLSVDPAAATPERCERLRELYPKSGLGIGVFASAFADARRQLAEGDAKSAIQTMSKAYEGLRKRGDQRIAMGTLHHLSLLLAESGFSSLAAETYGAVGRWASEAGIELLASEKRDRTGLRQRLAETLSDRAFERHVARGDRAWSNHEFKIG